MPKIDGRRARPKPDPIRVVVDLPPVAHAIFLATMRQTGQSGAEVFADALRALFVVLPRAGEADRGDFRARLHEAVDVAFGEERGLGALDGEGLKVLEDVIARVLAAGRPA
jgi:hypothetical protein